MSEAETERGREEQVQAIKTAIKTGRIKSKRVIANIFKPSVTVKEAILPYMPDMDLGEAVKWEVEQSISFPIDVAVIDHLIRGEVTKAGVRNMEAEVVVVKRPLAMPHLQLSIHGRSMKVIR